MNKKRFVKNIAIYLRLSKDDGDKEESESIFNQRKIIKNYILDNFEFDSCIEYVDDGYSGTNFNRPGFQRMYEDIKAKKINLVITKNLSRFGRNYIESGKYIEKEFPNNGVRYIAVLDKIDNFEDNVTNNFAPIKGVFNELYCRETSKAVKKSKREKMKKGYYACTTPPYGYKKSQDGEGILQIDENVAKIVKLIFKMKAEGKTQNQIADYLNENSILTPAVYLRVKPNMYFENSNIWTKPTVCKILGNPVYLGHCYRGKTQAISYKSRKSIYVRREDCIITRNTHEAIISEDLFNKAHKNQYGSIKKPTELDLLLRGLLYCNECGKSMNFVKRRKWTKMYCKSNSKSSILCSNNKRIVYENIEKEVIEQIITRYDMTIKENDLKYKLLNNYCNVEQKKFENDKKILNLEIGKIQFAITKLYNDRISENIDKILYQKQYTELIKKRKELNNQLKDIENIENKIQSESNLLKNKKEIQQVINRLKKRKVYQRRYKSINK